MPTDTNDCIETEVAAEFKRIQAWNESERAAHAYSFWPLNTVQMQSLANHLVRNRLHVETARDAQHKRLVEAATDFLLQPAGADGNEARRQLRAALKAEEEAKDAC